MKEKEKNILLDLNKKSFFILKEQVRLNPYLLFDCFEYCLP